jgi:hypothetical protein
MLLSPKHFDNMLSEVDRVGAPSPTVHEPVYRMHKQY